MIAEMTHIRLIGLKKSESKIIDDLSERTFEVRSADEVSFGLERGDATLFRALKLKQSKVAFAVDFISRCHAEAASIVSAHKRDGESFYNFELSARKFNDTPIAVTRDDMSDARAREYELMNVCDELEKISFDITDCRSRRTAAYNAARAYEPYVAMPIKFSELKDTGAVSVSAYIASASVDPSAQLDGRRCAYEIYKSASGTLVVTVCRIQAKSDVDKTMSALGFTRCAFDDDCTAVRKIDALAREGEDIDRHIFELLKKALDYEKYYDTLKMLYDVFESDVERAEADERFLKTDSTFVLEGWMPTAEVKSAVSEMREKTPAVFIQTLAPEEKDEPPTLVLNNKVVNPYEQITNMYSPPKYREIDPNPIMAIFFFIFFGLMIGDAVYGVVLAVAGFMIGMSAKFGKGVKQLALLVGMGGISAVVWGILFGGYLSIDFKSICGVDPALWFNPIEDPMTLLVLCIVFGCVQLCLGYVIKFIKLCKDGKPFSAIFDAGSIIILFGALACLACTLLIDGAPKALTTVGIVLAAVGLALIIIFGGRNNKNAVGKIFGGFKGVYGLVNLLSDILSYCRLFGLALATVAIGLAFNTLGSIIFEIPGIGYPLGVIILIPLHVFNLAIGVLGAYVHNARLQFLEFYGKFYDGGGRLFVPLGNRAKYTRKVYSGRESSDAHEHVSNSAA